MIYLFVFDLLDWYCWLLDLLLCVFVMFVIVCIAEDELLRAWSVAYGLWCYLLMILFGGLIGDWFRWCELLWLILILLLDFVVCVLIMIMILFGLFILIVGSLWFGFSHELIAFGVMFCFCLFVDMVIFCSGCMCLLFVFVLFFVLLIDYVS